MARLLQLTPDAIKEIATAVSTGAKLEDAAAAGGVHRATLSRWIKRGRDASSGIDPVIAPEDQIYVDLADEYEKNRAIAKVEALQIIRRAALGIPVKETRTTTKTDAQGNVTETTVVVVERIDIKWTAAAWFLERNYPEEFALTTTTRHEHSEVIDVGARADRIALEAEAFLEGRAAALEEASGEQPSE